MTVSIKDIEHAINFWRAKDAITHDDNDQIMTLGLEARLLSNVYGLMIYNKATEISLSKLTEAQRRAIDDSVSAVFK